MKFLKAIVVALKVVEVNWFPVTYILANLITNSIHAWLTKDYRSPDMTYEIFLVTTYSPRVVYNSVIQYMLHH